MYDVVALLSGDLPCTLDTCWTAGASSSAYLPWLLHNKFFSCCNHCFDSWWDWKELTRQSKFYPTALSGCFHLFTLEFSFSFIGLVPYRLIRHFQDLSAILLPQDLLIWDVTVRSTWIGEGNETFLVKVWKLLPSRRVLKLWGWWRFVTGQNRQYLRAVTNDIRVRHQTVCQRGGGLWGPTSVGEGNETFLIRVLKPLPSRRVLKMWDWRQYVTCQNGQYLLAVGVGRYSYPYSLELSVVEMMCTEERKDLIPFNLIYPAFIKRIWSVSTSKVVMKLWAKYHL